MVVVQAVIQVQMYYSKVMDQLIIDAQHTEVVMLLKHHTELYQNNVMPIETVIFIRMQAINGIVVKFIKLKTFIVMITEIHTKNTSIELIHNPKTKKISIIVI